MSAGDRGILGFHARLTSIRWLSRTTGLGSVLTSAFRGSDRAPARPPDARIPRKGSPARRWPARCHGDERCSAHDVVHARIALAEGNWRLGSATGSRGLKLGLAVIHNLEDHQQSPLNVGEQHDLLTPGESDVDREIH